MIENNKGIVNYGTFNAVDVAVGQNATASSNVFYELSEVSEAPSPKVSDIISILREQAQNFPYEHQHEAISVLDSIEVGVSKESSDKSQVGQWLKRLISISAAVGTVVGGAVAFSGDVKEFTNNVLELTEVLGIPIEQVRSPVP